MDTTEHTPGPWVQQKPGLKITAMQGDVHVCDCRSDDLDSAERHANARLIVAAPNMLEALRYADGSFRCICPVDPMSGKRCVACLIRDAIAKAAGV